MALLKDSLVAGDLRVTGTIYGDVPLDDLVDADDLKAIEALSGTSGTLVKTAANTWELSSQVAPSSHTHGNLTNEGKIGNTANYSVVTTTGGAIDAISLAVNDPSANGTATAFIDSISQATNGKITASKKNLPTANTSTAGIVKLNDTVTGTSTTEAATANAVKTAYDIGAAAIPKSIGTETGDLIYWSANATPIKLAIGETDQVLKVVNGIPTWTTDTAQEGVNDLIEAETIEEQEPYIFRKSGGNKNASIGNREEDTIIGGSIAWNQLVQNGNFASTSGWVGVAGTITASNNVLTYTPTGSGASFYQMYHTVSVPANHVALIMVQAKFTKASTHARLFLAGESSGTSTVLSIPANTKTLLSGIRKESTNQTRVYIRFGAVSEEAFESTDIVTVENAMVFDLTQMFGSVVADAVYAMEQANAGTGVAWFKAQYPLNYYEYNTGELKSVEGLVSHDMVGFNAWDEKWELGSISGDTGENTVASNRIRSKEYIHVLPNTDYYFRQGTAVADAIEMIFWYDANKNFISRQSSLSNRNGVTTSPSNAHYLRFRFSTAYGTTYKNDICINLSWSGTRNGEYEPYVKHSYPLDSSLTLRGIPKWGMDGMYYDGDRYHADGTVERRYGIVDLGTLTWTISEGSPANYFQTYLSVSKITPVPNGIANAFCTKYSLYMGSGASFRGTDSGIWVAPTNISSSRAYILIRDDSYTDATTFKTAMSGVMLVYELATPTTESANPYASSQIVDKYGTEEYVITGITPIGHRTLYQDVLSGKMSYLPDLAENDGTYLIKQQDNQMSLTKFGDYVEKAGDTMTGYLTISNSGNAKLQLKDTNSNGEMFIGFGAAHQNHGIYSYGYAPTTSTWTDDAKWMIYRSYSGAIILNGNATSATGFASAKSIALTGNVTGSASGGNGSNGWSIATTIGSGVVTNTMLAGSIANEKLVNSKVTIADNDVSLGGSITAATLKTSLGLNSAMHYIGKATVDITDGSTTDPKIGGNATTLVSGDVVIDSTDSREYVWNGSKWELLGGDSSYALSDHTHTTNIAQTGTSQLDLAASTVYTLTTGDTSFVFKTPPNTTYTFDGTYNASSNKAATVSTVTNAINALDGGTIGTPGAGKTITALSQTNGNISATFGDISITKSQISDFPTAMTPTSHTHGKITDDGKIASTDNVTIANNDRLVISDASDNYILKNTSIVFDGSTATKALTQKGTWETFNNYSLPLAASGTRGGIQIGYSSSGQNYAVQLNNEQAYVNVPWTDTQQNITLQTTTKGYITAVETAPTSTAAAQAGIADTGVYLTTTAGEINATQYKINEKSYISYDTTVDAIGFTFV